MPIFQDDLEHASSTSRGRGPVAVEASASRSRQLSEDSIRTELCEGPVLDDASHPPLPRDDEDVATSDRAELIEMLKRGASPTWIPNRHLESIMQQSQHGAASKPSRSPPESPALLPPVLITPDKDKTEDLTDDRLRDGLSIERPRSALHSGDFTTPKAEPEASNVGEKGDGQESLLAPDGWLATSPPRHFAAFGFGNRARLQDAFGGSRSGAAPLSSSLSSFIYQPPTSPLVQSETNDELDEFLMRAGENQLASSKSASARRHTLHSSHSAPFASSPSPSFLTTPRSSLRREGAHPYQAHQPRRSLTGTPNFFPHSGTSPHTPALLRSRRMSIGSDTSPLHHASMVGSYEESILRGRMSTTPSKPIEFLAQIGVLGKGRCKASLRCPAHVTLPFPAVYFSYSSTPHGRSGGDDGPSPYVGQIDLENGLGKKTLRVADEPDTTQESQNRKASRLRRRSGSPKAPPGGSYRIPEQGQVQIIIKNQNKTAVKLFLVPYNLAGMTPGTKTFIRQRSYSVGPTVDGPHAQGTPADGRIVRYLIHLHICCPSRGRYYLYKSIRLVFANRVPDGKEKLRNETTWPDPQFTPYKPVLMNTDAAPMALGDELDHVMESEGVSSDPWGAAAYAKLRKGDAGYGGESRAGTEGLLSQRLRGLGVKSQQHPLG